MPLLGKRVWVPNPPLKDLTHGEEVWVIRFTDETFRSYEDYLAKWEHYRQPVWTCRYTGRSGLTYEEAMLSETDAEHVSLQIPEEQLIGMALQMHKFVGSQDALAERVQKHFREDMASGKTKPITKAVIKQVIKLVADKDGYKGAPWMLKKDFCAKHNLTVSRDLPPTLMEAKLKYDERHKRDREEDEENDEDKKDEESDGEASPAKKIRLIEGPTDDLALEGADKQPPTPTRDFPISKRVVGDMLMAFTFLVSYRQNLGLQSTFTLGDFENVLLSEDHSDLMEEMLVRLLKSVYYGDPTSARITSATYSVVLRKWLRAQNLDRKVLDVSSVLDQLQDMSFHDLAADIKITILALLIRACLDSAAVRQHLDESYETSLELKKEEREYEEEEKQRERITAAFERKKKQTELNLEKMVAKLRSVSLGYDRHYRRYWFWPAAGPRLWVETPPASFYDSLGIPHPPDLQANAEEEPAEGDNMDKEEGEEAERSADDSTEEHKESRKDKDSADAEADAKAKAEAEAEAEAEPSGEDQNGEPAAENGVVENGPGAVEASLPVEVSRWAYYDTIEQVDELIAFLNEEGPREKELKANLERKHQKISDGMNRPYYSSHARQRVVMVPQYDMPVRRSSRLAAPRPTTSSAASSTETRASSRRLRGR